MKKTILSVLLFLLSSVVFAQTSSIERIRLLYQKSPADEETCKKLIDLLKSYDKDNTLLLGYRASATIIMAKHVFNPFKKLSYFKKGSEMLQKAIKKNRQNVELRFLRFSIQTNLPSFLGYNDYIQADKQFLMQSIPQLNNVALKKYLISSLESMDTGSALKAELSR